MSVNIPKNYRLIFKLVEECLNQIEMWSKDECIY